MKGVMFLLLLQLVPVIEDSHILQNLKFCEELLKSLANSLNFVASTV